MSCRSFYCRSDRVGFTLIEMLMVMVIIAVLIGLLVPVIAGAYRQARQAAEVTEIQNLVTAIQKFYDRTGVYPPSQIILREDGAYNASNSPAIGPTGPFPGCNALDQNTAVFDENLSIQYVRRIWPQMVINTNGSAVSVDLDGDGTAGGANDYYDWNGDGTKNGPWYLQGDECLVFFLGGIPTGEKSPGGGLGTRKNSGPPGALGFSKKPAWPTERVVAGAGRDGPFFDFPSGRLMDRDQDEFYELVMFRQPSPPAAYAYFSSYDGAGYRPDDLNLATEPNGSSTNTKDFAVLWPLGNYPSSHRGGSSPNYYNVSEGPNPYTIGPSYVSPTTNAAWVPRYHKPGGFQIVSPGPTAGYGDGGEFPLPTNANTEDTDNLSNFSRSELSAGAQ